VDKKINNLEIDSLLGHYRILKKIGAGGMGEVYLAEDTKLDRKVAIKFLNEEFSKDADKLNRFIQEAKAVSALNHPNILTVYEIGENDDSNYIVTEFIEGKTLREHLSPKETNSLNSILKIAVQVAEALSAAHQAGIIHRDIKPENIMIRRDRLVKILDFGLAKLVEKKLETLDAEAETRAQINTKAGTILGTVSYMSPEQARGKAVDERTDIWSLGVVLYEMLTGKNPFSGETISDSLAALIHLEPKPLDENLPSELQRIVRKTLQKDAGKRYQTIKDLLIDLEDVREELKIQNKLERLASPHREETKTQILNATTTDATHASSSGEYIATEIKRHKSAFIAALMILLLTIGGLGYWFLSSPPASATQIQSIAVMPFVNESGNSDNEYLSDGMTESLITSLSQLPKLSVKARNSVFRYKGKEVEPRKVGAELSVQAILLGRVVQRGNDLTFYIELVDANTENTLWKADYNRSMKNLVSLQNEIARDVSQKLRQRLTGAEVQTATKSYTENNEAYQLYLMGRYHLNRLTDEGFRKGRDYFEQAIDKDPNYALAFAGLADAYARLSGYNAISPNEGFPKARTAASKALELDDQLAEAHSTLGVVKWFYDWDWSGAEKEFKRAIEINPNNADAHQTYGYYLSAMQRFDEALAEMSRARELDPLSIEKILATGDVLYQQRRLDQATEQYQKALEMDPNSGIAHWAIGNVYLQKGMYDEAIKEYQKSIPLSGDSQDEPASLAYAYALSGKKQEALRIIEDLKQRSKRSYISPTVIAFIYAGLGENDQAFEWLEKAYNGRDFILVLLKVEPTFDRLRSDPRFEDLLRRVGLPQ